MRKRYVSPEQAARLRKKHDKVQKFKKDQGEVKRKLKAGIRKLHGLHNASKSGDKKEEEEESTVDVSVGESQ
jgi:hypothetical protein